MQFYIKSNPISVGVSINDRLNHIAYIIGKGINTLTKSIPWTGSFISIEVCRDRKLPLAPSCKKTVNGFLCLLIVFLESKTHQLNFEGRN